MPNVVCKISGVSTEADHANWTREELKPYISHAIDTFGFDRVMYGGDWHVLELAGTYSEWVSIVDWIVEGSTLEEKRKLFRDNAIAVYRLSGVKLGAPLGWTVALALLRCGTCYEAFAKDEAERVIKRDSEIEPAGPAPTNRAILAARCRGRRQQA